MRTCRAQPVACLHRVQRIVCVRACLRRRVRACASVCARTRTAQEVGGGILGGAARARGMCRAAGWAASSRTTTCGLVCLGDETNAPLEGNRGKPQNEPDATAKRRRTSVRRCARRSQPERPSTARTHRRCTPERNSKPRGIILCRGIPCRVGYHAVQDTMPRGIPCHGYVPADSATRRPLIVDRPYVRCALHLGLVQVGAALHASANP
jgi:hypothetical protein